jgi:hypothetical protein
MVSDYVDRGALRDVGADATATDEVGELVTQLRREVEALRRRQKELQQRPGDSVAAPPPAPAPAAAAPAPAAPAATADCGIDVCKQLWAKKAEEFVAARDARRVMDANRPPITDVSWATAPQLLRAVFWDPYDPEYSCDSKRKTGIPRANGNDGPKWTCGIHMLDGNKERCLVFSLGSSNVIDFESEMYKWTHCEIHVFDPTVDGTIAPELKRQANATLHLVGLAGQPNAAAPIYIGDRSMVARMEDLNGLMALAGATGRRLDVLKADIESYEWETMPHVFRAMAEGRLVVGQVQLELHINHYMTGVKNHVRLEDQRHAMTAVRRMFESADAAGLMLFSKEPNTAFCGGVDCGEWAWVSVQFAVEEFIGTHCPSAMPRKEEFAKIPLPPFPSY